VKRRQADAAAYVEMIFEAVRENKPVSLTHRQAVALLSSSVEFSLIVGIENSLVGALA
jgi:hypothetical protein